ncbi:MAG: ISL3 family transposase, partial [Euryarchaeota archaeon]|nr:ISL3 family transposase [Euryarchaeota archaeon]
DEISLKKGHKDFVTIVTARVDEKITILAVLKGRKKETVKEFLYSIPKRLKNTVKVVCSDMYEGYNNAATEVFGKDVIVIVDRFHVAKLYRKDLDGIRKKEMNRLKKELSEKEYKRLKNVMWILRKNIKELTDEEQEVLKRLFRHSPILEVAYKLCNDLTDIFEDDISKSVATRKIGDWKKKVEESGLKCFNKFISTLDKYMDKITNYFINRQTSGFVEGLNNKIKVIKRRCYGILNVKHLFQRIYLDLTGHSLYA